MCTQHSFRFRTKSTYMRRLLRYTDKSPMTLKFPICFKYSRLKTRIEKIVWIKFLRHRQSTICWSLICLEKEIYYSYKYRYLIPLLTVIFTGFVTLDPNTANGMSICQKRCLRHFSPQVNYDYDQKGCILKIHFILLSLTVDLFTVP